ncbi:MAG: hypothetical protein IH861_02765 [Chloroflexi bacterium]|nr:hypothetical protein [Chloroflexota bacterium]
MKHLGGVWETLKAPGRRLRSSERGVTGLETAIILIAFVVVASVFAFTVLSTGIFSAERGKETVFAALKQARGSVELKGSIVVNGVVDVELSDADTAWNASSNVTATVDATDKKVGTGSADLLVATAFTTGLVAYEDLVTTVDLTNRDSISLWVKSGVNTTLGQVELIIDNSPGCASALESIDLPALTANTWKLATVGVSVSTDISDIQCVGLNVTTDLSTTANVTVNLDSIIANGQATSIVVTIGNAIEGEAVDLAAPSDADDDGIADQTERQHKLLVTYNDKDQLVNDLYWTKQFVGVSDDDDLLEIGERVELTIQLAGLAQSTPLTKNKRFQIEVKPAEGSVLSVERAMPAQVDVSMNLR